LEYLPNIDQLCDKGNYEEILIKALSPSRWVCIDSLTCMYSFQDPLIETSIQGFFTKWASSGVYRSERVSRLVLSQVSKIFRCEVHDLILRI